MTIRRLLVPSAAVALLLAAVVVPSASGGAGGGEFRVDQRYEGSAASPPRTYHVYVPAGEGPFPLVVMLHGCNQDGRDVARGTRLNEAAAERALVVLYPEQPAFSGSLAGEYDGNEANCWNWFLEDHQHRGRGEPAAIARITARVRDSLPVDPRRVYVAGLSAGADMAAVMAATYPDVYAGVGVIAGCAYRSCTDVTGAMAYAEMGGPAAGLDPVPAFIVQGTIDVVSNVALDHSALRQWLGTNDWIDDGAANGSVPVHPASVEYREHRGIEPGNGDPCIGPNRLPCAGGLSGIRGNYPYTVERYADADGRPLVEHWLVHGLNHAYPGGDPAGTFTDPLGPDVTNALVDFFLAHPRPPRDGAARGR